jgi:hypothetical protein
MATDRQCTALAMDHHPTLPGAKRSIRIAANRISI